MGLWDAFKNLTKPYGDEDMDDELDVAEPSFPRSASSAKDSFMKYATPAPQTEQSVQRSFLSSMQRTVSSVKGGTGFSQPQGSANRGSVNIGGNRDGGSPMKLVVLKPEGLEDAREAAEALRSNNTVVLDLEETTKEELIRLVDFISGAAYILGGKITRLSTSTYLVTPPEVNLSGGDVLASLDSMR